jgi:hypothetical protein
VVSSSDTGELIEGKRFNTIKHICDFLSHLSRKEVEGGRNEPGAPQRQCEMKRLKSPCTIEGDRKVQSGTDDVERAKRRGTREKDVRHEHGEHDRRAAAFGDCCASRLVRRSRTKAREDVLYEKSA